MPERTPETAFCVCVYDNPGGRSFLGPEGEAQKAQEGDVLVCDGVCLGG